MAEDVPQGCDRKPAGLAMDREDEWWLRAPEPLSLFFFSPASFSYALGKRAIAAMLTEQAKCENGCWPCTSLSAGTRRGG